MNYKIGILGGIGPYASANFYNELIVKLKKTKYIKSNKDFPQIIINSVNAIEILGNDNTCIRDYILGIKEIDQHAVNIVCMICNTIHLHYETIKKTIKKSKELINLPKIVEHSLKKINKKICILGSSNTIKNNLYTFSNVQYIYLSNGNQKKLDAAIYKFNNGSLYMNEKMSIKHELSQMDTQNIVFLAGCTEVVDILELKGESNVINTMDILLDHIIKKYSNFKDTLHPKSQ